MTTVAVVAAIAVLIAAAAVAARAGGLGVYSLPEFYAAGKDAGFALRDIRLLHRVAREAGLANPSSLFWSQRSLDRCIEAVYARWYAEGLEDLPRNAAFLDDLFRYRKTIELSHPRVRFGIQSSRSLDLGQPLKIVIDRAGAFRSRIVENTRTHLAIAYPTGKPLPRGFSWRGKQIRVVLWRRDDAAYTFETTVSSDYLDRAAPVLQIAHVDRMERRQKRASVRAPLSAPGRVTPVRAPEEVDPTPVGAGGYRCRMVDISEDGAALYVGGRAKAGINLRIETAIDEHPVVLAGTVRTASYDRSRHLTLLHIQAEVTDLVMKNRIRAYVFGIARPGRSGSASAPAVAAPASAGAAGAAESTGDTQNTDAGSGRRSESAAHAPREGESQEPAAAP